jgi:hypothetical protein
MGIGDFGNSFNMEDSLENNSVNTRDEVVLIQSHIIFTRGAHFYINRGLNVGHIKNTNSPLLFHAMRLILASEARPYVDYNALSNIYIFLITLDAPVLDRKKLK